MNAFVYVIVYIHFQSSENRFFPFVHSNYKINTPK